MSKLISDRQKCLTFAGLLMMVLIAFVYREWRWAQIADTTAWLLVDDLKGDIDLLSRVKSSLSQDEIAWRERDIGSRPMFVGLLGARAEKERAIAAITNSYLATNQSVIRSIFPTVEAMGLNEAAARGASPW
jgi:hypothetical protein